ncbi:MAG: haloacid dehalogenase-like hydrolase [Erysipelotrichaceae bacterium]|nr:haloacid dehalogenase-like hydrolase [Erysipelotrichaceae bacterium]MDY5252427.1 haloacid dehalogenase-like hydrolase [Erysipelotrichaceae bacterium]
MNVYDFDDTIYDGDSTADFVKYSFCHRPKTLLCLPKIGITGLLFVLHLVDKMTFKKTLYSYFRYIPDMDDFVDEYVEKHLHNIKPWYYAQQRSDDVVISASPLFIVKRFCDKIGIKNCMASNVDPHTGKYDGENCWGPEKVKRFYASFPQGVIDNFYSDSYSDDPLAKLAKKAFIVKGNDLKKW